MKDKKYYEFLNKINYEGQRKDINGQGFVALNSIPFKNARNAIKFIVTHHPDYAPSDGTIVQNRKQCRELAIAVYPEVEYLLQYVEIQLRVAHNYLDRLVEQRDSTKDQFVKTYLQKRVIEQIGVVKGWTEICQLLHNRKYELWECTRIRDVGGII